MSSPEGSTKRRVPNRSRSNFLTRSATDDAEQLARRTSLAPSATTDSPSERRPSQTIPQYRDSIATHGSQGGSQGGNGWFSRMFSGVGSGQNLKSKRRRSLAGLDSTTTPLFTNGARKSRAEKNGVSKPRPGAFPRPVGGSFKLGTFAGVFVPTTLNVLSILMFLRFGFILGQSGVLGMLGWLYFSSFLEFLSVAHVVIESQHIQEIIICSRSSKLLTRVTMCFSILILRFRDARSMLRYQPTHDDVDICHCDERYGQGRRGVLFD